MACHFGFYDKPFRYSGLGYKYGSAILKKYPKRPLQGLFKKIIKTRSRRSSKVYYLQAGPGRFQMTGSSVAFFKNAA
jgi:hypothetical protein